MRVVIIILGGFIAAVFSQILMPPSCATGTPCGTIGIIMLITGGGITALAIHRVRKSGTKVLLILIFTAIAAVVLYQFLTR